jgi:two-component system, chemotaxis family, CheB/CheR fusion protein
VLGSSSKRVEEVVGSIGEEARLGEAAFEASPIA